MSSGAKCQNCGCTDIDYDPARGDAACVDCGAVVQQSLIVNEVAFQEDGRGRSNMVGQHVRADGQASFSVLPGHSRQATENTMMNARRRIVQLSSQLRLVSRHSEQALRLFQLAVERNFHKGRRVTNLACACLYIICRLEPTSHMLLDFSDVAQTNLFVLGHTFLKLVRLLEINLPIIDPSLYMHRFAAKLEYGEKKNAVAMTALRIAARMQRDWMTHGRRPAGLCGAALLTASVMHGFYRSQSEVARVVRIGNVVLRNRLRELDRTSTASLTAVQIDAGGGDDGKQTSLKQTDLGEVCDPPAFVAAQARKARALAAAARGTTETAPAADGTPANAGATPTGVGAGADAGADADAEAPTETAPADGDATARADQTNETSDDPQSANQTAGESNTADAPKNLEETPKESETTPASSEKGDDGNTATTTPTKKKGRSVAEREKQAVENEQVDKLMEEAMASKEMQALDKESRVEQNLQAELESGTPGGDGTPPDPDVETTGMRAARQLGGDWAPDMEDAELSDLDDEDTAKYISTEEEFKRKEELWTETNKDYLERQARLEALKRDRPEEFRRLNPGRGRKRRKSSGAGGTNAGGEAARAATPPPPPKPSKKLNYSVLQTLEDGGELGEV